MEAASPNKRKQMEKTTINAGSQIYLSQVGHYNSFYPMDNPIVLDRSIDVQRVSYTCGTNTYQSYKLVNPDQLADHELKSMIIWVEK